MKSDLDALMGERNLDAIIVLGNAQYNPPMYYLTGGGHVNSAILIKKRNEEPILFCNMMERDEAKKSGLTVKPLRYSPTEEFLNETGKQALIDIGVTSGRVGLYGEANISVTLAIIEHLTQALPDLTFVGEENSDNIFMYAMESKDQAEITRIRKMGSITTEVVGLTADYLTSRDIREDEVLLKEDNSPLTIADVKRKINLWLAERGAVPSAGYIFAIGSDAGVPHSQGKPDDLLRLGQTIVFDIYPQEQGGGYFYDFTRTWSLGYATPEAQKLYDDVHFVYDTVVENLDLNVAFKEYQKLTCDEFHKLGHNTPMHTEGILTQGYVHSLGHGLGLNVHERPSSRHTASDDNILKPGVVITIEPGLYYPEKGMGFRIEDTYWVRPDGKMEILAEYPYDFVLEMKKWKK
ncbi:MAG: Xaa-Pro peptidase family protein [Anaerolineales bacterium]